MVLVVGGVGQGKLAWVLSQTGWGEEAVFTRPQDGSNDPDKRVFYHLEGWVRGCRETHTDPAAALEPLLAAKPDLVVVCDEVGCGVVPTDPADRAWREEVGRLTCALAQEARGVVRVFCGLATVLKGELPWS